MDQAQGKEGVWLAAVADVLATPLFILDEKAKLMYANLAAQQHLTDGAQLRLVRGRVRTGRATWQRTFNRAFAAALAGERQAIDAARSGVDGTLVPLGEPKPAARSVSRKSQPPRVLLALSAGAGREVGLYAAHMGLTPTETRVLRRLASGASPQDIATSQGCTAANVRSYLTTIRKKTGHTSLAGLLRELAQLPPLAPPLQP